MIEHRSIGTAAVLRHAGRLIAPALPPAALRRSVLLIALALPALALIGSCAFHPRGEREERELAKEALPTPAPHPLSAEAPLLEILNYAYASNAELQSRYWEWRAAIERIPQEASIPAAPAVSFSSTFEDGDASLSRTTIGIGNAPMTMIPWPGTVSLAGRRALELARAAGLRFASAKLALRTRVLTAYYDYALLGETIRLESQKVALLGSLFDDAQARLRGGSGGSLEILKARTELDLARNDLESLSAKVPGSLAMLNAIVGREHSAPLALPLLLPAPRELPFTDAQILAYLAERNPKLASLAREAQADEDAVALMRQRYIPGFGFTVSGDLEGIAQSLMAMITAPFVRFEAIRASIAQAEAELEAVRAMRTQTERDLTARAVFALYDLRNAERQARLFEQSIIPRMEQAVRVASASYAAGVAPLADVLDTERTLVDMNVMYVELRMEREKLLSQIEELAVTAP
jgi:cobalt-zinc-cadmium efflux system outer membrane protein